MLKWAVNGPRLSYLQNEDDNLQFAVDSSNLSTLRLKTSWLAKENQNTSTPLQTSISSLLESPSHKVDSLRNLSNIFPELPARSHSIFNVNKETSRPFKTNKNTLPTFDDEYSPSALIPGPILALRGIGIADSYFNKSGCMTSHFQDILQNVNEETLLETKMLEHPGECIAQYPSYIEASTFSSTKMGDATLERMLDAILESNCKSHKQSYHPKQSIISPTYTPAEDPASDLQEVWDSEEIRYRQRTHKLGFKLTKKILFNEKEICFPLLHENTSTCHLKRQRCLRRKRNISQITTSVVSSAQKLLFKGRQPKHIRMNSGNIMTHNEIHPQKHNLSPDSGHNSSCDYDEKETYTTLL